MPEHLRAPAAHWIETNLITDGGARRPYPLAAVDDALRPALRHLSDRRLMRIEYTEQGDQVELVHDRLAAVASQRAQVSHQRAEDAERLRQDKATAEMEVLKQRARMAEIAEDRAHDAQRASRRALRLTAALAVVAGLALAAAYLAWNQRVWAEAATTAAREATGEAEYKAAAAQQALNAFTEALSAADKAKQAATMALDRTNAGQVQAAALLSDANRSYQSAAKEARQLKDCPAGRRIYPKIGRPADRAAAQNLLPALRAAGFIFRQWRSFRQGRCLNRRSCATSEEARPSATARRRPRRRSRTCFPA